MIIKASISDTCDFKEKITSNHQQKTSNIYASYKSIMIFNFTRGK